MKKLWIAALLLLGTATGGFAQNAHPKIIALLNKASWCPVCQANGSRFQTDIAPMVMGNKEVSMVMDDLSNNGTKASSMKMLKKAGIAKFAKKNTATGMLFFLDGRSKKLISKISIAESDDQIKQAYQDALSHE